MIAALFIAGFNGQWRIGPDSAVHVTVARSLADGNGYTHPTGLQDTINPGLAYLTAATFDLFGTKRFIAIDAVMLLCSVVVLTLTYWVVRLRFDRPTAVLVVCMLGFNETFYRYGYQVLTDMPFLLGLMLMLLGNELLNRRGAGRGVGVMLVVVSVGVMAAFRSVVLTVLAAGVLLAAYRVTRGPGWARYFVATSVVVCVLLMMRLMTGGVSLMRDESRVVGLIGGQPLGVTLHRVFLENGPTILTEHLPEAMFGVDFGAIASAPLGLLAVVLGLALFKVRPLWGLLVALFLAQWLVFVTTQRYVLVVMPLLALSWWRLGPWLEKRLKPGAASWVVTGLLVLWFAPNLVRVGAFIVEQRSRPFLQTYDDGHYAALNSVAKELSAVAGEKDVIIADDAPQLTYFTDLPVYGPDKLPTFGPARDMTLGLLRSAERVVLVSPAGDKLNERIINLKLRQERVLTIVPTPGYDRRPEYKLILMRMRDVDWDNYRRRREILLQRARAAEQRQDESDQHSGEGEQPDDQPR